MKIGLLGKTLKHSYSPAIHRYLSDYRYDLLELSEEELFDFLPENDYDGFNVTIPYKKTVLPFMKELGPEAEKTGSVNTILRLPSGGYRGENTDVSGFLYQIRRSGISPRGKKILVLGNGGAAASVCRALEITEGETTVISRRGPITYEDLPKYRDAEMIVNTTPLGMYPENGAQAVDLRSFGKCTAVFDLIYNPARTALLLQAEELGIPGYSGLSMLVAQGKCSAELFTGRPIPDREVERITGILEHRQNNLILIGMPAAGKTSVARIISDRTGRPFFDSDEEIRRRYGRGPEEILLQEGEETFRTMETEVLRDLGRKSGAVISTGGGAVKRPENYPLLHQNGIIVYLQRPLRELETAGRPLSACRGVTELYREREPLYRRFSDLQADNGGGITPEEAARRILERTEGEISE